MLEHSHREFVLVFWPAKSSPSTIESGPGVTVLERSSNNCERTH